jgi:PAS domain S-box-containing protein
MPRDPKVSVASTKINSLKMKISPLPNNERERLVAMKSYHILDTEEEKDFDDITELAALICDMPVAIITLIDEKRQWFKAKRGWTYKETHRDLSFCAHTIHMDDVMIVPDTLKDDRFFDNPLVTEDPAIRFYAGMPLITRDGYKLGTLAVIDKKPGMLSEDQVSALRKLGRQVVNLLSLRLSLVKLDSKVKENAAEINEVFERVSDAFVALDKDWRYTYVNEKAGQILNRPRGTLIGKNIWTEFPEGVGQIFYRAYHLAMEKQHYIHVEEYYPPFDKWFENHIYPSTGGLSIFFRDITEKKKAEEKLRMADQLLAYHLHNSPLGVIEWDKHFIIRSWSAQTEKIFGWTEAEVINKHFDEISLVLEEEAHDVAIIAKELMTGAVNSNNILNRNRTKSGNIIYCQWFNSVLKDEKGDTHSILSLIQDVTVQKQGEEEIKKAHERFEMIASTTHDAIWEWNLVTGERWANELHQQLYGLTKADPVPTEEAWKERIHPEDRNKIVSARQLALTSSKDYWQSEYRFKRPDGSYIVLFDRSYIIRSQDGGAIRLTGSMFDITERKQAEETVKHSEEKRSLIMNAALDAIICIDTKGKISFWNPKAEQIFGWKAEEVMGRKLSKIIIPVEYRKMHDKGIEHYLKTGYGPRLNEMLELSAIDRNGREFPIELTVLAIKQVGEEFFCAFIRDITGRKKAENAIRKSEEKYRTLVDQASDAIFIADTQGRFITVNKSACRLAQYPEADLLQMSIYDFAITEDIQKNPFHFDELKQGKTVITERVMKRNNGVPLDVEIIAKLLSDGRLLVFVRDISERIKAQNEIIKEKNLSDSIINSLPGIFYMYTREGKFLRWNKNFETVTKYSADEITVMHPLDFFAGKEKELLSRKINNVFVAGEDNVEAGFLLKTGEKIPYYFTGLSIEYDGGECMLGVGIDISERVRTQEKVRQTSEQLRQLAVHLQTVREEERKRIAREIHDELGQQLTAIKMDVAWVNKKTPEEKTAEKDKLKNVINLLDGSNRSIRRILSELRPAILDDHGLLDAIEWLGRQFTVQTGIPVKFTTTESELKLPEPVATCIFRVYQEALTNITRYARASEVIITLTISSQTITFRIKDDGKGFDTRSLQQKRSFGILGMKERVLSLNGTFELLSVQGKGTEIIFSIPYHNDELI